MKRLERIVFIHDGKAHYPSVAANRTLFAPFFKTVEMTPEEARRDARLGESIGWQMMGFYPRPLPCALAVHDYKSLSLGRFSRAKDWLKRYGNARPDVRIIKEPMLAAYGFGDGVPQVLQDIGVNDDLRRFIRPATEKVYDFCYVGAMTRERRFDAVLRAFLASAARDKTFVLVGAPEAGLREAFAGYPNLVFTGVKPQAEVYGYVQAAAVSVSYFPSHYPHRVQTPTKLLEAAALGARILMNDQPMNRQVAARYGITAEVRDTARLFDDLPPLAGWPDNAGIDREPLFWSSMVRASGIAQVLERVARAKGWAVPAGFVAKFGGHG